MNKRKQIKSIREGKYLAEVNVELLETNESWSPYLSLQDAYKLDDVREALQKKRFGKSYESSKDLYFAACPP